MGIEIAGYQYKREGYFLIDREFELSEIRLLCDAVAASDMIKESSSKIIIKKLPSLLMPLACRKPPVEE